MLDREVVKEFLLTRLDEDGYELNEGIDIDNLTEVFCQYVENDYYDWLVDNYNSFEWINDEWVMEREDREDDGEEGGQDDDI